MICPVCGDVVYESAAFCLRCGTMTARMRQDQPDTTLERPSRPSLRIVAGILIAVAAVLIVTSLSLGRPGGRAVRYVPNVVGRSRADAETRLAKAGFECVIGQGELSNAAEAGAVIRQLPGPGTPTSRNTQKVELDELSDDVQINPYLDSKSLSISRQPPLLIDTPQANNLGHLFVGAKVRLDDCITL